MEDPYLAIGNNVQLYMSRVPELSTGHFSWTRPGEKLTQPAIADKKTDPTRSPTLPHTYSL